MEQQVKIIESRDVIGAEVHGVDLSQPLSPAGFTAIEAACHDRAVLCLRQQHLTEPQFIDFARRFGEVERIFLTHYAHPRHPEIMLVSNIQEHGRNIGHADAGRVWHTDMSYTARPPRVTMLYKVIADHLETFLASLDADPDAKGLPAYVQREFYDYLQCGILAHGFLRLGCDTCQKELLLPFSCKRRGFCPSCAGRRMAQMAAHLVERVIPWVPTRQWVVSVPIPLRYWMASSKDLTATVHTTIRNTIGQYYVHQAVKRGIERQKAQPGSVTFI